VQVDLDLQSDRRTRNILFSLPSTLPHRLRFGTMEALSVDIGRLKSGEVNLGVRFSDIVTRMEKLIGELVHYLDIDYGRPVQGRSRHRR
jgi:hypothetical protein